MEIQSFRVAPGADGLSPTRGAAMKPIMRIPRSLFSYIQDDVARPHVFAKERVGFATAGVGENGEGPHLILVCRYHPVADDRYVNDPYSGARIDATAIREAL